MKKVVKKAVKKPAKKKASGTTTMKPTHLAFILDMSGSMGGKESDVIGGFNAFIAEQKKDTKNKAIVSVILFDDRYITLFDRVPLEKVRELTPKDYVPTGSTALLDAIGKTINACNEDRKVLVSIHTDGAENASREFSNEKIKELIKEKTAKKWGFVFLGADLDAYAAGGTMGLVKGLGVKLASTSRSKRGLLDTYAVMSASASSFRGSAGAQSFASLDAQMVYDSEQLKDKGEAVGISPGGATSTTPNGGSST